MDCASNQEMLICSTLLTLLDIKDRNGVRQVIWFRAPLPVRQWNSMCIVRNFKQKKFQIYQNDKLVLDYGECRTKGEGIHGLVVGNAECVRDDWIYK